MANNYKAKLPVIKKNERLIAVDGIYTMFEARRSPDFYFGGECHTAWEMVYVCDGSVGVTADEKVYTLYTGDVIFHHPMQFHKIWSENGNSPRMFIWSFDMRGTLAHRLKNSVYRLNKAQISDMDVLLKKLRDECKTDTAAVSEIYYSGAGVLTRNNPELLQLAISRLESFMLELALSDSRTLPAKDGENERLYTKIVDILENNVYSWITIPEIAEECGVSSATVKNCFSGYAGCGVHKYLLKIKMRTAIELMRSGKSVSETSEILQFANPNYFSYVFKRETGSKASDYMKK